MKNEKVQIEKNEVEGMSDLSLLSVVVGELVAKNLLENKNLRDLSCMSSEELKQYGLMNGQAIELKAVLEIARRFQKMEFKKGDLLNGSSQVFQHYAQKLAGRKKEYFYAVLLDCKHRIIREELVSIGSLNLSVVHPREVFRAAISEAAESIILVHNHPSGDPTPSREDINVTNRLVEVGKVVGIEVLDSCIIGDGKYVSFMEQGMMK